MLVIAALMALASAGPICKALCPDPLCGKVCDTPDYQAELAACEARLASVAKGAHELSASAAHCQAQLAQCKAKKCPPPPKKKVVKKKVVVKPPEPTPEPKQACCTAPTQVVVNVTEHRVEVRPEPRPQAPKKEEPGFGVGVLGAVGIWSCPPHLFGLVGLRARYLPFHLGVEVNTQFAWGHSAQLLVYPVQGPIAWHLNFGGLLYHRDGTFFNLLAGTGVEVEIVPHFSVTLDWRMTIPKPFNLGDSLLKSQLMLGLLLHTW